MLEAFANVQWIGEHYSDEQACELLLDRFKKLVEAELAMVEVRVVIAAGTVQQPSSNAR